MVVGESLFGTAIMPDESSKPLSDQEAPIDSTPPKKTGRSRKLLRATTAFVSFAFGLLVSPYASQLIMSANPEFFGPDNQQVIEDQRSNFAQLDSKLAELRSANADDPQTEAMIDQLAQMIEEQKALAARKDEMFKATDVERQRLSEELLRKQGSSAAVGFWLKPGESIMLKDPTKVLAVAMEHTSKGDVTVNISGEQTRMKVGDTLQVATSGGPYLLIYRHGPRESDGRLGFDLTEASPKSR